MFSLSEAANSNTNTKNGIPKIWVLIFGRFALTFLVLLASWWWTNSYIDLSPDFSPNRLLLLFLTVMILSVIYFAASKLNYEHLWQIRIQFGIDVMLVTWLSLETGNVESPYVALYLILISVAGFYLGRRETLLVAVVCAVSFALLSAFSSGTLFFSVSGDAAPSRFVQVIGFKSIAILIVGLLAAHLADRHQVKLKLKATEESFEDLNVMHERIVESIRSGLITMDLSGKIRAFNHAAQEISGRDAGKTIGESVYVMFGDDIRPAVEIALLRASEGNEFPTEHFEAVMRASTPRNSALEPVTVACSVSPLLGKTGMVHGLILTFQDISEIRAVKRSLRRSDRMAAVGRMAAGLAHEIRNPLGSMSSALQYLEENIKATTPEAELLEVVQRESNRLNHIITNFLSYSRLSSGKGSPDDFCETDLSAALLDCLVLARHSPEVDEKNHVLNFRAPEHPLFINADETQLKQVFWNLIQNSIHAMPAGGNLDVAVTDLPGEDLRITFEDTGTGISPEIREHLFEPFSSGSNGAGLGLSIVHKIISDHGGKIDIANGEKIGTKVTVDLPHYQNGRK